MPRPVNLPAAIVLAGSSLLLASCSTPDPNAPAKFSGDPALGNPTLPTTTVTPTTAAPPTSRFYADGDPTASVAPGAASATTTNAPETTTTTAKR